MSLFPLCFIYVLNKLSTNECHLVAVLMTYMKIHSKKIMLYQTIYILAEDKDVCHFYTVGTNSIYAKLLCPPIHVDDNRYVCMSLYDIIQDAFLNPKHLPAPFLPFNQSLHGQTPEGQLLLSYVMDNIEDAISKCLYPIMLFTWTDAFHPHNMVIKNSASLNTCMLIFGHLDGDRLENFSYVSSLRRKERQPCYCWSRVGEWNQWFKQEKNASVPPWVGSNYWFQGTLERFPMWLSWQIYISTDTQQSELCMFWICRWHGKYHWQNGMLC